MNAFDEVINRTATDSSKWDKYANQDVIPMWVADMDFAAPSPVLDAIRSRLEHPVLGYNSRPQSVICAIQSWLTRRYGWQVAEESILLSPGVVPALNQAVRAFVRPGRSVAVAIPTYPPFLQAPLNMDRAVTRLSMTPENGWSFPLDAFRKALEGEHSIDMLMLSHPMNPVGRVIDRATLEAIAALCVAHDVVICSDEIHCDLLLDGRQHTPLASISAEAAARTVTFQAASKTFNLAGLGCAYVVAENESIRDQFEQAGAGIMSHVNTLGFVATEAALTHGATWHAELIDYLRQNRDLVAQAVADLPWVHMRAPEATYLAWIDIRELELEDAHAFFTEHGVGIAAGEEYEGPGFVRLNYGCPQSVLVEGLSRMSKAIRSRVG